MLHHRPVWVWLCGDLSCQGTSSTLHCTCWVFAVSFKYCAMEFMIKPQCTLLQLGWSVVCLEPFGIRFDDTSDQGWKNCLYCYVSHHCDNSGRLLRGTWETSHELENWQSMVVIKPSLILETQIVNALVSLEKSNRWVIKVKEIAWKVLHSNRNHGRYWYRIRCGTNRARVIAFFFVAFLDVCTKSYY